MGSPLHLRRLHAAVRRPPPAAARGQLHGRPERLHPDRAPGLHDPVRPGPARPADPLQLVAVDLESRALQRDRRGRRPTRPTRTRRFSRSRPSSSRRASSRAPSPGRASAATFAKLYWTHIYNSTGHPMFSDDRTQVLFDGPEGLSAFQTIEAGLKSGSGTPSYLNITNEHEAYVEFAKGNMATVMHSESVIDPTEKELVAAGKLAVRQFPGIKSGTTGSRPGRRRHRRQQVDQAARRVVELLQPAVHAGRGAADQPARAGALPADPHLGPCGPGRQGGPVPARPPTRRRPRA